MVKTLVTSSHEPQPEGASKPVADDEIEPEAMEEIVRRVEQMRRGEDTVFSNEEVLSEWASDIERIVEFLDELS